MRNAVVLALIVQAGVALAAEAPPVGPYCSLLNPPKNAGEGLNHNATTKVYPRSRAISEKFTGCQILWVPNPDTGRWLRLAVVQIENGDPVRLWIPAFPEDPTNLCRYKGGKVIAGDGCEPAALLIRASMPPGCAERVVAGTTTPDDEDCQYDWRDR